MGTHSTNTRVRHDSNANYQEWTTELHAILVGCGLVQTADSGQIDTATVTRPSAGTFNAYSIWTFNDALQASAPIYIRIDFGTGSNSNGLRWAITVGTGSDGAGTLTGTALTIQRALMSGSSVMNSDTTRLTYACHTNGFFGINWKVDATNANAGFFIARTVDASGVPTAEGAQIGWGAGTATGVGVRQALRFASPAEAFTAVGGTSFAGASALGFMAQAPTSSVIGSDTQVALGWVKTPHAKPLIGVCGVIPADHAEGSTFSVTLFGSTSHTYLVMNEAMGPFGPIDTGDPGALRVAMLYE